MVQVFKPSDDGRVLVSDAKKSNPIRVGEHFFVATVNDKILSLQNTGVTYPPGPSFHVFQAVRVSKDTTVEGVNVIGAHSDLDLFALHDTSSMIQDREGYSDHIHQGLIMLPKGSVLLQAFEPSAQEGREWYGLTPFEQSKQNLQRVQVTPETGEVSDVFRLSAIHYGDFQKTCLDLWDNQPQRRAHRNDIDLAEKLGVTYPNERAYWDAFFGRA